MLESCFQHIPGIGPSFEKKLQLAGIFCWKDALSLPLPCGSKRQQTIRKAIEDSIERLEAKDFRWFGDALAPAEQWRLFPHCKENVAYVDIETTGLSLDENCITTIALYDGNTVRTYVQGSNLEHFCDDILPYRLLVTWNGRCFDAPLIRRQLGIPLDKGALGHMGHLDLLPVLRKLGFRGGLKKVEKQLGIDRKELDGVDGYTAVLLWNEYERTGNKKALETLLAYNVADVLGLEPLALYTIKHYRLPSVSPMIPEAKYHINPFTADTALLHKLFSLQHYFPY